MECWPVQMHFVVVYAGIANLLLTHLLLFSICVCVLCVKVVRMWHGQTRTKWIHRRGEGGSEETKRRREQTLQHGSGENCTGMYHICLSDFALTSLILNELPRTNMLCIYVPYNDCSPRLSHLNLKCFIIKYNRSLPEGSVTAMVLLTIPVSFQNKETNNQMVEQGALVAEEEVTLLSALSSSSGLYIHKVKKAYCKFRISNMPYIKTGKKIELNMFNLCLRHEPSCYDEHWNNSHGRSYYQQCDFCIWWSLSHFSWFWRQKLIAFGFRLDSVHGSPWRLKGKQSRIILPVYDKVFNYKL